MTVPPLLFDWNGEAMTPRSPTTADKHFTVGESYRLAPTQDRTARTHNHYFACINEAWRNLPHHLADRFPTPDHLRKWCLIKTGYREERTFVAASQAEAVNLAAFVKPIDDYAVVRVREAVVFVYTARSQCMAAMNEKEFAASKTAVLGAIAEMIGVDVGQLVKNTDKAA